MVEVEGRWEMVRAVVVVLTGREEEEEEGGGGKGENVGVGGMISTAGPP